MSNANVNTTVSKVETTMAAILGSPTGENIISQTPKNNIFKEDKTPATNITDIEKAAKEAEAAKVKAVADAKAEADKKANEGKSAEELAEIEKKKKETEAATLASKQSLATTLTLTKEQEEEELEKKNKGGRPEFQREGLIQVMNDLIKEEKFVPLDDPKPMEEWTKEDYKEFIELNISHREDKLKEEVPVAFFDSLPEEFQIAYNYFAQGGSDVKHILKVVSQAVEMGSLDPKTEDGQENIVRNYLSLTKWGTIEDIDEELASMKDRGELEKKANQFKPKLDAVQQENIERNLKAQEKARKNAEKAAANYMDSVYKTLEPGVLGGIKLTKKEQSEHYNALVRPDYQSFTGQQVNELAHLLETKQFGAEKDLEAVMLARWVLKDKAGFLDKVREQGGSAKATEVAKKLKIEQANKNASVNQDDDDDSANRNVKKLQRKTNNIFK